MELWNKPKKNNKLIKKILRENIFQIIINFSFYFSVLNLVISLLIDRNIFWNSWLTYS